MPDQSTGPEGAASTEEQSLRRRLQLARESYLEVLDATKHQDDKIGRFLTALAFLTTGAITLLFSGGLLPVRFRFTGDLKVEGSYALIGWATAGFFFCVLGSVAMLLLCLSAPLRLPGRQLDWGPRLTGSRLFFSYIGQEPVKGWSSRWKAKNAASIERELFDQYVLETHNLSERARIKYQHTNEASALFVLSLLFLGAAVVLAISAGIDDMGGRDRVVETGRWTTIGIGMVAATHAFVQLYVRVVHDRRSFQLVKDAAWGGIGSKAGQLLAAANSVGWLLITVPAFILAVAIPSDSVLERRVAFVFAMLFLVASFALSYPRWKRASRRQKVTRWLYYGVLPALVVAGALGLGGVFQILGVLAAPTSLSVLSVQADYRRTKKSQAGLQRREELRKLRRVADHLTSTQSAAPVK